MKTLEKATGSRRLAVAELLTAANNQYRVTWDALALELAVNALEHLDLEDLKRAVTLWLIESHWPPTIADLRSNYTRVQQERIREATKRLDAEQARELERIHEGHRQVEDQWNQLPDREQEKFLKMADEHPLREYMGREMIAKNILLFGDGKKAIGGGKEDVH